MILEVVTEAGTFLTSESCMALYKLILWFRRTWLKYLRSPQAAGSGGVEEMTVAAEFGAQHGQDEILGF